MADMNSMNRETKKRKLRQGLVSSDQPRGPAVRSEDSAEIIRAARSKIWRRRLILAVVAAFLVAAAAGGWFHYQRTYQFSEFEVSWEVEMKEGSLVGYEPFGNNVLKYTKDGASYTDQKGKTIWTESYEMKSPTAVVNGDYAAIADKQGNSIYICNTDGSQGKASTVLPISKVAVSTTGIVAAVLEDSTSSYINFFRKDGSALDITIRTNMSGDGYPMDISLSDDGSQLMSSFVYIQSGEVQNRVVFYDFSEVGKNVPNRLVGGFDEPFKDNIIARVQYLAEPYSCAFAGNSLTFFSSKNLASPELITQVPVEDEIQAIFYSVDYVGIIVRSNDGEFASQMRIYRNDGSPVMNRDFTYDYTQAYIDGNMIILHDEDSCRIFNMSGVEKLSAEFDFSVSRIRKGTFPNTYIVSGPQVMKEIKLR
ncbi:MAG: DUF5711 family protein [Lachnospiraceae bacterium]